MRKALIVALDSNSRCAVSQLQLEYARVIKAKTKTKINVHCKARVQAQPGRSDVREDLTNFKKKLDQVESGVRVWHP